LIMISLARKNIHLYFGLITSFVVVIINLFDEKLTEGTLVPKLALGPFLTLEC